MQDSGFTHEASAGATLAAFVASFEMSDKVFAKCTKWSRKCLAGTETKPTSDKLLKQSLVLGMCAVVESIRAAETLEEVIDCTFAVISCRKHGGRSSHVDVECVNITKNRVCIIFFKSCCTNK